jgi:hypothetical protein
MGCVASGRCSKLKSTQLNRLAASSSTGNLRANNREGRHPKSLAERREPSGWRISTTCLPLIRFEKLKMSGILGSDARSHLRKRPTFRPMDLFQNPAISARLSD